MNIQKRNRLIAAGTVTIVLLLVVLVAIMIYQLVVIVDLNKRKNELKEQIAEYYDSINAPGGLKDQLEASKQNMQQLRKEQIEDVKQSFIHMVSTSGIVEDDKDGGFTTKVDNDAYYRDEY